MAVRLRTPGDGDLVPDRVFARFGVGARHRRGERPPHRVEDWLEAMFPQYFSAALADRHRQLWAWVAAIRRSAQPRPFVGIWPRGGGKSTSAEAAVVSLGVRNIRKYCVYVRSTQAQADKSVANIAAMLESSAVARYYPDHAQRRVGKFGNARGWRREQLQTAGGFTVDAMGLDTAGRGAKVDAARPDLLILDDIDELADGPAATAKKVETITKSILPAGANDCAVLFIQNLIIPDGVASQLADGRADFLADRILSGPFPAVDGLRWEWQTDPNDGIRHPVITAGEATWEGQPLEVCQQQMQSWGPIAFLKEAQHEVKGRAYGTALSFDPKRNYVDVSDERLKTMVRKGQVRAFGGIDFQLWRFGFTLWFIDQHGKVLRVDEFFSQRESLSTRAEKIDAMARHYIPDPSAKLCPIWGDSANPQDILELNLAFKRLDSKLRVVGVGRDGKMRRAAVARINDALARGMLSFRRSVGTEPPHHWMLGANAGSEGTAVTGSRLMWEIEHWAFPVPKPGEPQDENPDDDTADGADLVASMRYALMTYWRPALAAANAHGGTPGDEADAYDFEKRRVRKRQERVLDDLLEASTRDIPAIDLPRLEPGSW